MRFVIRVCLLIAVALVPETVFADWVRLQSDHFVLIGNASEREIRRTAQQLETFREAIARALPRVSSAAPAPTVVVVFDTHRAMTSYTARPDVGGMFVGGDDRNYILIHGGAIPTDIGDSPYRAVFHEYTHYLLHNTMRTLPLWVNEGFAEFYAMFSEREGGRSVVFGIPAEDHVDLLRTRPLMPVTELIAADRTSRAYTDGMSSYYAHAWLVVHYLQLGNKARAAQLRDYLNQVDGGTSSAEAFANVFTDPIALQAELREYLQRVTFPAVQFHFDDSVRRRSEAAFTRMTQVEADAHLATIVGRLGRREDARARFRTLLAQHPNNAAVLEAAGEFELAQGRTGDAVALLERAAKTAPDDPAVQASLGRTLFRHAIAGGGVTLAPLARDLLTRADAKGTSTASTLFMLGQLEMTSGGSMARAAEYLARAVQLSPAVEQYRLVFADALIENGEIDRARAVLGPLLANGSHIDIRDRARGLLARAAAPARIPREALVRLDPPAAAASPHAAAADMPPVGLTQPVRLDLRTVGADELRVFGRLRDIECKPGAVTVAVETDGRVMRFSRADLSSIDWITYRSAATGQVTCGTVDPAVRAFATYKISGPPAPNTDGMAIAIELLPDDYTPQ